jgi:hypothetical protein
MMTARCPQYVGSCLSNKVHGVTPRKKAGYGMDGWSGSNPGEAKTFMLPATSTCWDKAAGA